MTWTEVITLPTTRLQRHTLYKMKLLPRDRVRFLNRDEASELIRIGIEVAKRANEVYEGNENE